LVPETIARFLGDAAEYASFSLQAVSNLRHTFDPARTPPALRRYEQEQDWKLPTLATKYPRFSTDREMAEENNLEWVTPGHSLFDAPRRHSLSLAQEPFKKGACFSSLQHAVPARIDFYRGRIVDGLGQLIHERLFAVELGETGDPSLREPVLLGDL